jgi:predicted P-loop ATPase
LKSLGATCSYDLFLDQPIITGIPINGHDGASGNINAQYMMARNALCENGFEAPKELVIDAIKTMCWDNCFNPVLDYLDELKWDGKPRLDRWLLTYCGAHDTAFNRVVGRKTLIAGVRRVRQPGCKFDYILSLEGKQGMGKSSLLRILAGQYFTDTAIIGVDSKRQQENVQGVWIYELAELVNLNKAEVREVKVFASQTHDKARKPWDRDVTNAPRKCIFIATTNEDKYLRDTTGNRRWWPVKIYGVVDGPIIDGELVKLVDLSALARDRNQLWAEASLAEASGEPLEIPQSLWSDATAIQLARMEEDPWDDMLAAAIAIQIASKKVIPASSAIASIVVAAPKSSSPPLGSSINLKWPTTLKTPSTPNIWPT